MIITYYIKFGGLPPQKWEVHNFEHFWNTLREFMLKNQTILEWIIKD